MRWDCEALSLIVRPKSPLDPLADWGQARHHSRCRRHIRPFALKAARRRRSVFGPIRRLANVFPCRITCEAPRSRSKTRAVSRRPMLWQWQATRCHAGGSVLSLAQARHPPLFMMSEKPPPPPRVSRQYETTWPKITSVPSRTVTSSGSKICPVG